STRRWRRGQPPAGWRSSSGSSSCSSPWISSCHSSPAWDASSGMFQYIDPVTDLRSSMLRVLVAALLGGLIGVERERSHGEQKEEGFAGARTFPLFAILG